MTDEPNKRMIWFRFDPSEWFDVLLMDDESAGARFKQMLIRLGKNEAPEDSVEFKMIQNSKLISQKQRERVMQRWNKTTESKGNPPPPPPPPPSRPVRRMRPPELADVYDFCDKNGISPTTGREWYEWQVNTGWTQIKTQWQVALRGFAKKKENPL